MIDTRTKCIQDLQRIQKEHYTLREGEHVQDFLTLMLQYIGDPQPELRDDLIYPTFYEWIHEKDMFTEAELRSLLTVLTDGQHLLYHIGSEGDQTVFTRTFSILPIALIVRRHRLKPFLDFADFQHVKDSILRYYKEEKDLRGYLPEGGWAHSAAHGADVLNELVQCSESDAEMQREVLAAIKGMLHNGIHIFNDEEDERIATIVDTMMITGSLPQQEIADWISCLARYDSQTNNRAQVIARVNSKTFLRCLYFRRGQVSRETCIANAILATETKLNKFAISKY
ncbi:DUF2785 domain-containing protein [Paenibacillus marinisediminis]